MLELMRMDVQCRSHQLRREFVIDEISKPSQNASLEPRGTEQVYMQNLNVSEGNNHRFTLLVFARRNAST